MMRKELNENELDNIAGGEVITSEKYNAICFTTLNEAYSLKNVSYKDAVAEKDRLYAANQSMGEKEFDNLVKSVFQENQWI